MSKSLLIYNTLTRRKEVFRPAGQTVRMFVCGPTVYDYIHIGNARTFVFFDVVAKYLRHKKWKVQYIQNITDIEDKIIRRAREEGRDPLKWAQEFEKNFYQDMHQLGIDAVSHYAPATAHIEQVVKQVKTLIEKGQAYLIKDDGYYFDLTTFPEYGKLSGRTVEMAEDAVSRIDENERKRNRGDFCLWKFSKTGEPSWDTELGQGRPGWHIEDTAITAYYFGPQYDLHGGGRDLIFPHHEAEIAQQESASGLQPFVRYWMHVAFIVNEQAKMSKSLGNFVTIHKLLENHSKEALRFFLLSGHYRSPLDYTDQNLTQSEAAVCRIGECLDRLRMIDQDTDHLFAKARVEKLGLNFETALDNDFSIPEVFGSIFETIRELHTAADQQQLGRSTAQTAIQTLEKINQVLGIIPVQAPTIPKEVRKLVQEREDWRQKKDFQSADRLRRKISSLGYHIKDTIYGPLVKIKK